MTGALLIPTTPLAVGVSLGYEGREEQQVDYSISSFGFRPTAVLARLDCLSRKRPFNVEVTGAAQPYRAASVWTAGLGGVLNVLAHASGAQVAVDYA